MADTTNLVSYVDAAIQMALAGYPEYLPPVPGFSSSKVRRLLNWLCKMDGTHYLEIGTHRGSTFIPALYHNPYTKGTCIDNFSLVQDPIVADVLVDNIQKWLNSGLEEHIRIINQDCFAVNVSTITPPVNVYFYDGDHSLDAQIKAFTYFNSCFADTFVAVVDDANYSAEVMVGTAQAWQQLGYKILKRWDLAGDYNGSEAGFWNGIILAVLSKG
jgi:hypothetical protein